MSDSTAASPPVNALSVDVEDFFQVGAFEHHIARTAWDGYPLRVEANVDRILGLMDEAGVHATFFTLGWVAERLPQMVRRIVAQGHELASHGYGHARATDQSTSAFLADIRLARAILEDITGLEVRGYRAPSFSVGPGNPEAFDAIVAAGYRYSSSVYPIRHDHYGAPDAPRFPYEVRPGLLEIPVATVRLLERNWPAGGGGFFRLLPYGVSRWAIGRVNAADNRPAMFYFHPWELDPQQPRVEGPGWKSRFRHYVNLDKVEPRLRRLLRDFRWDRVDRVFLEGAAAAAGNGCAADGATQPAGSGAAVRKRAPNPGKAPPAPRIDDRRGPATLGGR
jgi:polysaccharide deacetylase family protein (PEP-CTERM system associated)